MKKYQFLFGFVEIASCYDKNDSEYIMNYILGMDDGKYYLQRTVEEDDCISYYFEEN